MVANKFLYVEDDTNSEEYSADEDEYVPHEEVSHSSESSNQEILNNTRQVTLRRTRKQRRCENEWKRNQEKKTEN